MVTPLPLAGLDVEAASELYGAVGASLDPAVGVTRTGGNPLFLFSWLSTGQGVAR